MFLSIAIHSVSGSPLASRKEVKHLIKYDKRHDVLHIMRHDHSDADTSADEVMPGVYICRNDDTGQVTKILILDFEARKD